MTEDSKSEKPAIDFEKAMRRTHNKFAGVFKALAELERRERELAEKITISNVKTTLSDDKEIKE
jgi:hypothetical protein